MQLLSEAKLHCLLELFAFWLFTLFEFKSRPFISFMQGGLEIHLQPWWGQMCICTILYNTFHSMYGEPYVFCSLKQLATRWTNWRQTKCISRKNRMQLECKYKVMILWLVHKFVDTLSDGTRKFPGIQREWKYTKNSWEIPKISVLLTSFPASWSNENSSLSKSDHPPNSG